MSAKPALQRGVVIPERKLSDQLLAITARLVDGAQ